MKLILARHGETQLNRDGRVQGINDTPLNATGRAQARALAAALSDDLPFLLYGSTVARATETAQVISEALRVRFTPLRGLEEMDVGRLLGLTGQEMRRRFPDIMRRWAENPAPVQMPGGESLQEVQDRAWRAVTELVDGHPDETVVAVTHNFTIQTIICRVLGMPLKSFRRLRPGLGSITRLELYPGRGVVVSLSETQHLRQSYG